MASTVAGPTGDFGSLALFIMFPLALYTLRGAERNILAVLYKRQNILGVSRIACPPISYTIDIVCG